MPFKLPFFKNNEPKSSMPLHSDELYNIPHHVAIIMDGNGRWAKKRGLPRVAGHKEGIKAVSNTVQAAVDFNVNILTLFAFSTENWKRPKSEVKYLMRLPKEFLHFYLPDLIKNNVRIETIGHFDGLPEVTKEAILYAKEKTSKNDGLLVNFAMNYGGRSDILHAIKKVVSDIDRYKLSIETLDETVFSRYLYTEDLPDPDLLIRTSGEKRLSNFLLWQLAYSEFWFTDVLWPDFTKETFRQALLDYQQRKRRYGGIEGGE